MQQDNPSQQSEPLQVYIHLSSHMDPGWIYTFEEYYQGTNTQDGGCVKTILNNVFDALAKKPTRKYGLAEVSFFARWWQDQNEERRAAFHEYVKNHQFEFISGGWCCNCEACSYYEDLMDHFILGQRWLKDNFDATPLIGWQMDSFGNSATHAALMAQAGYEGLFFSRADYVDRATRIENKSLQFNWKPQNPRNESIFTQMLYTQYSNTKFMIEDNFWFRSIFHKGRLTPEEYKIVEEYLKKQSEAHRTKHILFLVCDDFHLWREAEKDFDGIEGMIEYFDEHPEFGIKVKLSHLTEYLAETTKDLGALEDKDWIPDKYDDSFPYIENPWTAWTGFFSSKSMFKVMVREYSQYYNAAKLVLAKLMLAGLVSNEKHEEINQALLEIEKPLGVCQHHDAVSGTMKEYVRHDYERMLREGRQAVDKAMQPLIASYVGKRLDEKNLKDTEVKYDWLYRDENYGNVFKSEYTPTLVVFNPGTTRKMLIQVKLPSDMGGCVILSEDNTEIEADIISHGKEKNEERYMYFVDEIKAYSFKTYKLIKSDNVKVLEPETATELETLLKISDHTSFTVLNDFRTFKYKHCIAENVCVHDTFNLDYEYYESSIFQGNGKVASGAYIFNPASQEKLKHSTILSGRIYKGKYLTLVQIFRDNVRTDLKLVHHQPERGIEIDSYLDPLKDSPNGREVVLLIRSSHIKNNDGVFFTDANGYLMQKRIKDKKESYTLSTENGIANSYYPMTSNAYIEDTKSGHRMSVVTDRSQGMTSPAPGEIEIMLHRVTIRDDWKGVSEPLQEKDPKTGELVKVTTRHYLMYSQQEIGIPDRRRDQQYDLDRPLQAWFYQSENAKYAENNSGKEGDKGVILPDLVKLYVRSYKPNEYLVRLHNLGEHDLAKVSIFDKGSMVSGLLSKLAGGESEVKVSEVTELSWITTQLKSEVKKNKMDKKQPITSYMDGQGYSDITLLPMEIRTFKIVVKV